MQLANSALLPLERFSLGGVNTVRGYRENSYIRDNGFNTNVEIKLPIHNSYFLDTGSLFLVPFMDYGGVWNNPTPTLTNPTNNYLFSSGIGFNWLYKQVSTDFYWAHAFTPVVPAPSNRTIQDDGIHFRVTINAF